MKRASYPEQDYAFGQLMLTLRTAIGITQAVLATTLGVSRQTVAGWEAGDKYPKANHLQAFISLAIEHRAFSDGREADEIRTLWKASRQKVLLDEVWLATLLTSQPPNETTRDPFIPSPQINASRLYWEDALTADAFFGRDWELKLLHQWVIEDRCRIISVLGMGGIGKSALTVHLMHQAAPHFEVVIWRSLRDVPTCDILLDSLLKVVAPHTLVELHADMERRQSIVLDYMRTMRVLLVLDNLESVLEEGLGAGQLRPEYEGIGRFLIKCAGTAHQSCVLLTSREKPRDLTRYESNQGAVRSLRLSALDVAACEQLLASRDVVGSPTERSRLIDAYAGNPLALKIVAQTIVDLFVG